MTPASLRRNYIEELKKCGDSLYKKNQTLKIKSRKLSFNEKFEFENLTKELVILDKKKRDLEVVINDSNAEFDNVIESSKRLAEIIDLIDAKELRWLELDDIQS